MTAEEMVAEIFRQKTELQSKGLVPTQLILTMESWRQIRAWHLALGVMEKAPEMDYISENGIFGLDVLIDSVGALRVR